MGNAWLAGRGARVKEMAASKVTNKIMNCF
jgi:hypothetical protein